MHQLDNLIPKGANYLLYRNRRGDILEMPIKFVYDFYNCNSGTLDFGIFDFRSDKFKSLLQSPISLENKEPEAKPVPESKKKKDKKSQTEGYLEVIKKNGDPLETIESTSEKSQIQILDMSEEDLAKQLEMDLGYDDSQIQIYRKEVSGKEAFISPLVSDLPLFILRIVDPLANYALIREYVAKNCNRLVKIEQSKPVRRAWAKKFIPLVTEARRAIVEDGVNQVPIGFDVVIVKRKMPRRKFAYYARSVDKDRRSEYVLKKEFDKDRAKALESLALQASLLAKRLIRIKKMNKKENK